MHYYCAHNLVPNTQIEILTLQCSASTAVQSFNAEFHALVHLPIKTMFNVYIYVTVTKKTLAYFFISAPMPTWLELTPSRRLV